jgi:hypothetical protein
MPAVDPDENGHDGGMGPFGSRLLAVGIGFVCVAVLVMLPFLVTITFYVVANVYALTKGTTFSAATTNDGVLLTLLVLSVAVFPVGLAVLVGLLGRALSPKRRRA